MAREMTSRPVFGDGKNAGAIQRPDLFQWQWGEVSGFILDNSGDNG